MGAVIGFSIGYILGFLTTIGMCFYLAPEEDAGSPEKINGIDPNELIAWIQNGNDNYEYIAPPSTSEIIRKIKEMSDHES